MAAWRLNPSLTRFRSVVDARYPDRDKTTDGTIGDPAHASRDSDHNPDPDGTVDAWDMDVDVNGPGKPYEADVEHLKRVFEAHPASRYWIHNDKIAHRSTNWVPRPYDPGNPNRNKHTKHVHWNTNQATETSSAPWVIEGDDVGKITDKVQAGQLRDTAFVLTGGTVLNGKRVPMHVAVSALLEQNAAIADTLARVANPTVGTDLRTQLEKIEAKAAERADAELARDQQAGAERAELRVLLEELDAGTLTQDELVSRIRVTVEPIEPDIAGQ